MTDVRGAFQHQSRACAGLGSPFMGRLMALIGKQIAPGGAVADRVLNWPGDPMPVADSVPLRLAGALHAIARQSPDLAMVYPPNAVDDDMLWSAVSNAMATHETQILEWLESAPQTNEVRRSAAIIPGLHLLADAFNMPIALTEIGTSGGLNLRADKFRLRAGATSYGPEDSTLMLDPDWTGTPPSPSEVRVVQRKGVDLNPIDPAIDADRLIAYLWPDQIERIARTEAAINIARANPAELVKADAAEWLEAHFAPIPGHLHVLFHTIAWQYLPVDAQARGETALGAAASLATMNAPIARLSMEAAGKSAALTLQVWPSGAIIDLGRADYHGRWIEWTQTDGKGLTK